MPEIPDLPERLTAALADRYRLVRELGQGGMATVYLAEDLKHDRQVAIKVLRPELAAVVGGERFLAEIRTTANLQHPNILPLFDSGEADSFLFYVMPYVEGESLREKLDREKQLGVDGAVTLARKVADALDYAHGKGVVHRDIKPANILLSERGEPLVADFGIALAVSQAGGGRITETGLSLGTPHYMSPEQATGDRDVDPRSDIYALGCVLYEMLAGQPPFAASTAQAVLARILTEQPRRVTELRRTVPSHVGSALDRALEKLPADRFESVRDFLAALDDPQFTYETEAAPPPSLPGRRASPTVAAGPGAARVPLLVAALSVALLAAGAGWLRSPPQPEPAPTTRAVLGDFPTDAPPASSERLAISPDGSKIAVISYDQGERRLYWRYVSEVGRREVSAADEPGGPGFSPDGQWLIFTAGNMIRRAELPSGQVFPVIEGGLPHWGTDDTMVFVSGGGLYAVSPMGGEPTTLIDPGEAPVAGGVDRPFLLPDGSGVLFQRSQRDPATGDYPLFVYEMDSGAVVDLGLRGGNPQYVASGHLVFGRQSQALVAVPFDLETLRPSGQPSTVLTGVTVYGGGATQFVASDNGTAFYEVGGDEGSQEILTVVDLDGTRTPTAVGRGNFGTPRWSPDGSSVAYYGIDGVLPTIYTYNVDLRQAPRQVTFDGANVRPTWSPDGSRVAFVALGFGTDGDDILVKDLDSGEPSRSLGPWPGDQEPMDWPMEDVLILRSENDGGANTAFQIVDPTVTDAERSPYFDSRSSLSDLRTSPAADLAVYVSDETGQNEVYLRTFPEAGQPERISSGGGVSPRWSADGETIHYWVPGDAWTLMAAGIRRGPPFAVLSRDTLAVFPGVRGDIDLHPDGDRIIAGLQALRDQAEGESARAVLVTNWFAELQRLLGGNPR